MITIEKIKEYEEYRGYYDGFFIQKVKNGVNLNSDDDWYIIEDFYQRIVLVEKGEVSKNFSDKLDIDLKNNCDTKQTIDYLKSLVDKW